MAQNYNIDLFESAKRHLLAAEVLYEKSHRKDVSGYLFGLSAECSLKLLMSKSGMRPNDDKENKKNDPFYAHFERLKTLASIGVSGRHQGVINKYVNNSNFFQHWDIKMRYSDGKDIKEDWLNAWRDSAKDIFNEITQI